MMTEVFGDSKEETEQGKKTPTEFTRETLPMVGWRILLQGQ